MAEENNDQPGETNTPPTEGTHSEPLSATETSEQTPSEEPQTSKEPSPEPVAQPATEPTLSEPPVQPSTPTSTPEESVKDEDEHVNISKTGLWKFAAVVLGLILIVSILTGGFGGNGTPTGQSVDGNNPSGGNGGAPGADDDAVKGDSDAPVTIVEFSDFQCPFCSRFYTGALGDIEKNYIETGKVKLVYRDFPLSIHPDAQKAAEAAECAKDQGKFWEMHDELFENQASLSVASLKQYASKIGLDEDDFSECLDSGEKASEVQADFSDGTANGVSGTPTFFVNGQKLVGAQPYSEFEAAIEAALAA